jgi:hypothetical protein
VKVSYIEPVDGEDNVDKELECGKRQKTQLCTFFWCHNDEPTSIMIKYFINDSCLGLM